MSLVVALTLALGAAPPVDGVRVDAPLILAASAPASDVETILVPWVALRAGKIWDLSAQAFDGVGVGADGAVWLGGFESEGTPEVNAQRFYGALELRGLASMRAFSTTNSALSPFAFVGLRGGGGLNHIGVFEDSRTGVVPYWGTRAGLGLDLAVFHVVTRAELAAGLRDARLEWTSGVSLGGVF